MPVSTTLNRTDTPAIAKPLSVQKVQGDMCSGLTSAQLMPYMGAIGKQAPGKDAADTPLCAWSPNNGRMANVTLYADGNSENADNLYEKRFGDNFFEKIPLLAGYPAVRVSARADGPKRGDCMTIAAVSDRATITVFANTVGEEFPHYASMCTVSDRLAEAAIQNLKAAG
ncbi:DUF3558 family protein [Kibdelosporangium philippinense]|uniref:DUF3558 family protein n=1 Tax=Kibdelosporangium philippinense TaxID=211113 RepID=UPI0036107879